MNITEADLPGVGKKHVIEIEDGSELIVITHHNGRRELYRRPERDADSERIVSLSDELARKVGTILEGAYFQPEATGDVETMLGDGTLLEWYEIIPSAPIVGEDLQSLDLRDRFGLTVIAIQRGSEVLPSSGPKTSIEAEDVLVVIGSRDECEAFESALLRPADK